MDAIALLQHDHQEVERLFRQFEKLTERNFKILDVLLEVAAQLGRPPAEVALSWVANQPGVSSTIIGA